MELTINGIKRKVPAETLDRLEVQFGELEKALAQKGMTLFDWMETCQGDRKTISAALKISQLGALASEMGMEFLFTKTPPCPIGH